MNILILILNRIYFFLSKVKNQSPFLGTIILGTLLITVTLGNIKLAIYAFKPELLTTNYIVEVIIILVVLVFLFWFSKKKKSQIIKSNIKSPAKNNIIVSFIFLFTVICFILLANINREKIFTERKAKFSIEQLEKQKSLERKLRDWWNGK